MAVPRSELQAMARLAIPVVLAELGWMALGVVDTVMVGDLGAAALGGIGIARVVFLTVAVLGMGVLFGLDTLVSIAWGASQPGECRRYLLNGLYLAALLGPALTGVLWWAAPRFAELGITPEVSAVAVPCLRSFSLCLAPLLVFTALRRYLQGIGIVRPIMIALVSANFVNLACNWALIHGRLGLPRLGATGSPLATGIAVVYMACFLGVVVWRKSSHEGLLLSGRSLRPDLAYLRPLVALGLPAAGQMVLELGAFAAATALAGRLEPQWVAAHHLALTLASVTFMVPLGVSAAGAVRVGHALGRGDARGARSAGWMALMLGGGFMAAAAIAFLAAPRMLLSAFTSDSAVLASSVGLLYVAALFQLFDGLQVVATGVLRGAADTRTPLTLNALGHWVLGLPTGYYLCFVAGQGVIGLWIGWLVGLGVTGLGLLFVWDRRSKRFAELLRLSGPLSERHG